MENWREIRQDILEALEDSLCHCKVKYYKPKDGECSYFRVEIDDVCVTETEVESMLEEVLDRHTLEPVWMGEGILELSAIWDEEDFYV